MWKKIKLQCVSSGKEDEMPFFNFVFVLFCFGFCFCFVFLFFLFLFCLFWVINPSSPKGGVVPTPP